MNRVEKIQTKDGSDSLWMPDLDETYHSRHGALQEAKHVFIEMGLNEVLKQVQHPKILEVGLGTGLNCWLSFQHLKEMSLPLKYTALEAYPLEWDLVSSMNYASEDRELFEAIHRAEWGHLVELQPEKELLKIETKLENYLPSEKVNLVYFDAFGPNTQPEMWLPSQLQRCYDALEEGGIFVTYCAKGQVRRDLVSCGFEVERLPGPPGKREMLRGRK
ncbi:MAG: tRNA (5-methylaminomethyl-2-thiouridine)(34)-methyltransferase MnmD [Flavobacteriales bacterium]|nr:tRNA (5-methylaminomethyl-2-thiouridine)(34)-methyltransferase MnmD [Flavobacteriales bacterium]